MAFDLIIEPATFDIPYISDLESQWASIPQGDVRKAIAQEHQFLEFHLLILDRMHYTAPGKAANPTYKSQIDFTLRAGAIKAAILIAASICEAALRGHAEKRGYALPPNARHRTFGKILETWSDDPDVNLIYTDLCAIKDFRNNVHLFVAVTSADADYMKVLANETMMLAKARHCVAEMMKLKST